MGDEDLKVRNSETGLTTIKKRKNRCGLTNGNSVNELHSSQRLKKGKIVVGLVKNDKRTRYNKLTTIRKRKNRCGGTPVCGVMHPLAHND